jgi:excisionase family DNA binding protein
MSDPDTLLTTSEVCAIARVTRDTVARWARTGQLPVAFKLPGGQFRFRRSDVDRLLAPEPTETAS